MLCVSCVHVHLSQSLLVAMSAMEVDPVTTAAAAPTSAPASDTPINQTIYVQNLNEKIKGSETDQAHARAHAHAHAWRSALAMYIHSTYEGGTLLCASHAGHDVAHVISHGCLTYMLHAHARCAYVLRICVAFDVMRLFLSMCLHVPTPLLRADPSPIMCHLCQWMS